MSVQQTNDKSKSDQQKPQFRILLIEDNENVAQMMLSVFGWMGQISDHAVDIETAHNSLQHQRYDLVFVDVQLGHDDGLDFIESFKHQQPDIDFISMTGDNTKIVETRVRELRVLYHLVKPFDISELTTVLRHTINRSSHKSVLFT